MSIVKLQQRIAAIKQELAELGDLRPGSLSQQYNTCGNPACRCKNAEDPQRHGPYYQLTYTRKGRSHTEFVRRDDVDTLREQLATYARFRTLTDEWIECSIEIAALKRQAAKRRQTRRKPHAGNDD